MTLYPHRAAAVEHEVRRPLSEGLEDLLSEPMPVCGGDRSEGDPAHPAHPAHPTVDDYYDVQAIAAEVLGLFVTGSGCVVYHCLKPGIYPSLFREIAERHALRRMSSPEAAAWRGGSK